MEDGHFRLRWINHTSTFSTLLHHYRSEGLFCDATIACDKKVFKVHQAVLSACSDFFFSLFASTQYQNPIIVLQDVKAAHVENLLQYMYCGEARVPQQELSLFLKLADTLQIKGLAETISPKAPSDGKKQTLHAESPEHDLSFQETHNSNAVSFSHADLSHKSFPTHLEKQSANIRQNVRHSVLDTEQLIRRKCVVVEKPIGLSEVVRRPSQGLENCTLNGLSDVSVHVSCLDQSCDSCDKVESEVQNNELQLPGQQIKEETPSEIKQRTPSPAKIETEITENIKEELPELPESFRSSSRSLEESSIKSDDDDDGDDDEMQNLVIAEDDNDELELFFVEHTDNAPLETIEEVQDHDSESQLRRELLRPLRPKETPQQFSWHQVRPGLSQMAPRNPLQPPPLRLPLPNAPLRSPPQQVPLREPPPLMKIMPNHDLQESDFESNPPGQVVYRDLREHGFHNTHLLVEAPPIYHPCNISKPLNGNLGMNRSIRSDYIEKFPTLTGSAPLFVNSVEETSPSPDVPLNLSGQRNLSEIQEDPNSEQFLEKIASRRRRHRGPKSWEYLVRLIKDPSTNPSLIRWEDEATGTFRLVRPSIIAQQWGRRASKHANDSLSYENFARGLRYHYATGALHPVSERNLVYRFGTKALALLKMYGSSSSVPAPLTTIESGST